MKHYLKTIVWMFLMSGVAVVAYTLTSCGGGRKGTGLELPYPQQVKNYYDHTVTSVSGGSQAASSAYFDLSDGIIVAYKTNADCGAFLNQITQTITSGDVEVYSMANDQITRLEMKQTQLYNKIMDASSYRQAMAPIEKTLEKIVADSNSALLVTDFEEYTPDKRVQHAAFASKYFTKWLREKGDITFFVFNYVEKRLSKHLYFVVFDTPQHQLLTKIRQAATGIGGFEEFCLSRDAYSVSNNYKTATTGGSYHSADKGEDLVTAVIEDGSAEAYTRYGEGSRVEYYPLGEPWNKVVTNAQAMTEPGNQPLFTDLLRGVLFNFSNKDSYEVKRLELRVTDVEADFTRFETNRYAVSATDPSTDFHYDEYCKLLPEYEYEPQPTPEISDMLVVDQRLFDETKVSSNGESVELGINFSSAFGGKIVGANPGDLLRVDVCIADCEPNLSDRLDELFYWGQNGNLRDAVRNTLQDVNPRGTVIYTYFLKCL